MATHDMSENQRPPPAPFPGILATFEAKIDAVLESNEAVVGKVKEVLSTQAKLVEITSELRERFSPIAPVLIEIRDTQMQIVAGQNEQREQVAKFIEKIEESISSLREEIREDFSEQQAKLRGVLMAKMDGLQSIMDMLRERVQNSWNTADFAITSGRNLRNDTSNLRDETDRLLTMISTMQKQQNLLESQVEVLRRNIAEKDGGVAKQSSCQVGVHPLHNTLEYRLGVARTDKLTCSTRYCTWL